MGDANTWARHMAEVRRKKEAAREKWNAAHVALDELRGALQDVMGRDMEREHATAGKALDAFLASGGVKEQ